MARVLEIAYIATTDSLERGNARAAASTEATAAKMGIAHKKAETSYFSMAGAGARAAAQLEGSHSKIASSMTAIGRSSTLAIGGIVAVGAAVEGTKRSVDTLAELAKETRTLHNVTGLSVQSASAYAAVAKVQDVPVKALNMAFGTLSKNIHAVENAHSGATKSAKAQENALKQLGLPLSSITKAHGDLNKLLPEITKRFEEMPGSVQKTAIGMALFGRGWQTLVPLMHSGALGLSEQLKVAKEMGATLSGSTAQQLKEFAKQQEEAKYASLGLQLAIGQYLAPALTKMIHWVAGATHELAQGVHWLEKHKVAVEALAGVVGGALSLAFAVFVSSKAKLFIAATKDMVKGIELLAAKFGLMPKAAAAAGAETAAAQEVLAGKVAASDDAIIASNAKASKSFGGILGKLGLVAGAVALAQPTIEKLTGGNLGETEAEGQRAHNFGGTQRNLDTGGGIMGFFMSKGLSAAQAAGIVGNIQQESGLNPKAAGGGFFQGIGSRAGLGKGGAKQQLEAAWAELQGAAKGTLEALRHAKTPQQAARIFSERFERPGTPMLSNRERYAREAYAAHPQNAHTKATEQHTKAMEQHSKNLGYYESASKKAASTHGAAKHRAAVEGYVDPFAQATGLHQSRTDQGVDFSFGGKFGAIGPGIIEKVKNFQGFGETIVQLLTAGPQKGKRIYYALETGATGAVHAGQHVHAGQMLGTGKGSGGVEFGFAGPEGLPIQRYAPGQSHSTPLAGGEAFAKFLSQVGKTGSNIELAGNTFQKAAKQAEHLTLTIAQRAGLHAHVAAAGRARGLESLLAGTAGAAGAFLEAQQTKWARQKPDLSTKAGQDTARGRGNTEMEIELSKKKYYQAAVRELQKEAHEFGKIRDSYRKFAKHAKGPGAKKAALTKAAEFDGKVKAAQHEAQEMGGNIATAEAAIEDVTNRMTVQLPEEIAQAAEQAEQKRQEGLSNDLSKYQADNSKVDLEVRAGLKSEAEGKAAKIANANRALSGGYGALSEEGHLQVLGDLKEFAEAVTNATNALEAHTKALEEATKVLKEFNQQATGIAQVESGVLLKAMADLISGQIGGVNMAGRAMTAGSGSAARY